MNKSIRGYIANMGTGRMILYILLGVVFILVLIALLYWAARGIELQAVGQVEIRGDLTGRFTEPRVVERNGIAYQYRSGLTTILLMGIDKTEEGARLSSGFRNGGQADFLMLLVIDSKDKTITPLQIDRDTMAEITILGVLGNEAGTRTAQVCLSHGFGDGKEQSSKFTVDAVSKLLLGVDIDFYVAVNLDAISIINDMLDGVTVTLEDDFAALDPAMTKGSTLTLRGDQAEYYVRNRMGIGIGTNEARMARQREYLQSALSQMGLKAQNDKLFMDKLLDSLGDSLLTNMKRGRIINEFYGSKDYKTVGIVTPGGVYQVGIDGFMEFHADETALEELVIRTFFTPQPAS